MERQIVETFEKEDIQQLPTELFDGQIYIIQTEAEATKAVAYLLTRTMLGIDTETKPSFKKGRINKVALLQVATHDKCFLFRLNHMENIPTPIQKFLEDRTVTKVGLALKDDIQNLLRRDKFSPGTFIDIQDEVTKIGIKDKSLQKIYANLFGKKIAKRQQLSNWEADSLSEAQQRYAATDAWACIKIHEEIQRIINETNIS